jgi:hypothetical protein
MLNSKNGTRQCLIFPDAPRFCNGLTDNFAKLDPATLGLVSFLDEVARSVAQSRRHLQRVATTAKSKRARFDLNEVSQVPYQPAGLKVDRLEVARK